MALEEGFNSLFEMPKAAVARNRLPYRGCCEGFNSLFEMQRAVEWCRELEEEVVSFNSLFEMQFHAVARSRVAATL